MLLDRTSRTKKGGWWYYIIIVKSDTDLCSSGKAGMRDLNGTQVGTSELCVHIYVNTYTYTMNSHDAPKIIVNMYTHVQTCMPDWIRLSYPEHYS